MKKKEITLGLRDQPADIALPSQTFRLNGELESGIGKKRSTDGIGSVIGAVHRYQGSEVPVSLALKTGEGLPQVHPVWSVDRHADKDVITLRAHVTPRASSRPSDPRNDKEEGSTRT